MERAGSIKDKINRGKPTSRHRLRCLMLAGLVLGCCLSSRGHAQKARTYVVAQDGSGDFRSIQQAFDAISRPNKEPVTLYIREGIYHEKLHLDSSQDDVTLIGAGRFKTILSFNDHAGMTSPEGKRIGTRDSYTFEVRSHDFTATDLTIRNDAGFSAGQAVALRLDGDKASFFRCRLTGFQDVLFTSNPEGRAYFKDCYIEGTTDFIFGSSTALFQDCHIHSKKNSHVTAASTPQGHRFGYVFIDCTLTGDTTVTTADLGRPWRPYATVAFLHCYLGRHLKPEGWSNWHGTENYKTTRFSEYQNFGPGSDTTRRVDWARQLTETQAAAYTLSDILRGWVPACPCPEQMIKEKTKDPEGI